MWHEPWHDRSMTRTRISTTVDADLLAHARRSHGGKSDSELIDDALAEVGCSDVAVAGRRASAQRRNHRDRLLCWSLVEVVHHDARAVTRQSQRDLLSDATAGAGHDPHFAVELSHASPFLILRRAAYTAHSASVPFKAVGPP